MQEIKVRTKSREEMIDITSDVEKILDADEAWDGICVVFTHHTTCGVTVNENADPDVQSDMLGWLRRLVPQFPEKENRPVGEAPPPLLRKEGSFYFKHGEQNSDAHIKSSLVGCSVTVPFENGKLLLGRWQSIYLCEFDGPRERKMIVSMMGAGRTK
jgi:secondary thiamine-phosphate synthase enzyme